MKAKLLHAASPDSADMLYATGFQAPDAFFFLEQDGRKSIFLNDLEIDRGRREARVEEVLSWNELVDEVVKKTKTPAAKIPHEQVLAAFLQRRKIRRVEVPGGFPLASARGLERAGIKVELVPGLFWPEREFKSAQEIKHLRRALRITEAGLRRAAEVLGAAQIGRGNALRWNGRQLTSEIVRAEADAAVLRAGGTPAGTIVAGGRQACDPHERGHGPLRAHELIIVDIFPRDARTGYFGDLTRTFVRGRASEEQRRMWQTVCDAQKLAIAAIKPGAKGAAVHKAVQDFFRDHGYPTEKVRGRWAGFFHGTGHALGLDLHEAPRLAATTFRPGQVFTVEPGLYYPTLGGARHEDVVLITLTRCTKLSRLSLPLELGR